jgi:hypothetical protein
MFYQTSLIIELKFNIEKLKFEFETCTYTNILFPNTLLQVTCE